MVGVYISQPPEADTSRKPTAMLGPKGVRLRKVSLYTEGLNGGVALTVKVCRF